MESKGMHNSHMHVTKVKKEEIGNNSNTNKKKT
jgi:hypothetical protein